MEHTPSPAVAATSWWTVAPADFGAALKEFGHSAKTSGDAALPEGVRAYLDTVAECQHRTSSNLPPSRFQTTLGAIR